MKLDEKKDVQAYPLHILFLLLILFMVWAESRLF